MAEKEERILVLKATEDDFIYKHFNGNGFIHRQETIEKMAKALCICDDDGGCKGVCNPKCDVWKYSLKHAEAALDALLSSDK